MRETGPQPQGGTRGQRITQLVRCRTRSVAGLFWVQPASAQALPANFISPNVPHDVPAGPGATVAQLAVFAWQEFIALNWQANDPAQTGTRGRPNRPTSASSTSRPTNGSFPLVVWQTYRHKNELFPASGTYRSTFDSFMPTYRYKPQPPRLRQAARSRASISSTISTRRARSAWPTCMPTPAPVPPQIPRPGYAWPTRQRSTVRYSTTPINMAQDYTNPATINGQGTKLIRPRINTGPVYTMANIAGICSAPTGAPSIVMLPCGGVTYPGDAGEKVRSRSRRRGAS